MYGMIHRGIRQMVIDDLGEEEWALIEREVGIGPAELISLNLYEDELTLRILSAAATRMGCGMEQCLGLFGRYWVRFAERGSYGAIMDFAGNDLAGFISSLDRIHQAVLTIMPEARVPSFSVTSEEPGRLTVLYRSEREGLEPLVAGLLEGILDRFGLNGAVAPAEGGANRCEFIVTYDMPPG